MSNARTVVGALLLLGVAIWSVTPARLRPPPVGTVLPDNLDAWLRQSEGSAAERFGLVPGTEKRIRWFAEHTQTPYAVVYLHGFSATRQETAPLAESVARMLGANLYETRLRGHGRIREQLHDVYAEDWLQDAAEALAIGTRLGQKVIVIGTSTGATLAAAMVGHPAMSNVDTLVMLSPNFAPRDSNAAWLTRPAGPLLARMLAGETRSWQAHNELQERYWSTTYPMASAVQMMRLVDLANRKLPASIEHRLLMFYSMGDAVVSPELARRVFAATEAPGKTAIEIGAVGDPSQHVLAGDVLSAETTGDIARRIVDFIAPRAPSDVPAREQTHPARGE